MMIRKPRWLYDLSPSWFPKWLCATRLSGPAAMGVILGLVFGGVISWVLTPTPWMDFETIAAQYDGQKKILLTGRYYVRRECTDVTPVLWLIISDETGKIAVYGPRLGLPSLTKGNHTYVDDIEVEGIKPKVVRVVAVCPGETREMVASALTTVTPDERLKAAPK